MRIDTGKTIKKDGPSQFGRCTRHKDPFQCSLGAEGLYLLYRFETSSEFYVDARGRAVIKDVTDNSSWFDLKMLTEYHAADPTKRLEDSNFRRALQKVFQKLRIISNHTCHFGRTAGPLKMEFEELSPDLIRLLGKFLVVSVCFIVSLLTKIVIVLQAIGKPTTKRRVIRRRFRFGR